jgi:DNA-binding CsgD family transcriptional regulator
MLSGRERQVLRLIAAGRTNAEIADTLFLSPHTVRTHVRNSLRKLGVSTRAQAVLALERSESRIPGIEA